MRAVPEAQKITVTNQRELFVLIPSIFIGSAASLLSSYVSFLLFINHHFLIFKRVLVLLTQKLVARDSWIVNLAGTNIETNTDVLDDDKNQFRQYKIKSHKAYCFRSKMCVLGLL
ncbi:unnamed protein product [Orchesella dallaii]|uniref:Transmembrane protein n=1 Tax=Orchesella dallaii TaxID=48710 RepID=A0ABP1QPJ0_9HEXA